MVIKMARLVYGSGINDADYNVFPSLNGKRVICPFYMTWKNMLARCYSDKYQAMRPTYIDCSVCFEWKTFSNFRKWMEAQNWQGKHLDKDLLIDGNKVYSADTCIFVDAVVNSFTIDCAAARGEWSLGVCFNKQVGKFQVRCSNPFTKKKDNLGYFACPNQAHEAWRRRKHELACQLAAIQDDLRVATALRTRYLPSGMTSEN